MTNDLASGRLTCARVLMVCIASGDESLLSLGRQTFKILLLRIVAFATDNNFSSRSVVLL